MGRDKNGNPKASVAKRDATGADARAKSCSVAFIVAIPAAAGEHPRRRLKASPRAVAKRGFSARHRLWCNVRERGGKHAKQM